MKITSVRSFLMSYPLAEPQRLRFLGGERTIVKRDAMLIRVATDKGLVGYAPGPGSEIAHAAIEHTIAPFLEVRPDCPIKRFPVQQPRLVHRSRNDADLGELVVSVFRAISATHGMDEPSHLPPVLEARIVERGCGQVRQKGRRSDQDVRPWNEDGE